MIFRQLFDRDSCTYTYILGCKITTEALIIDPVFEQKECYLKLLKELGLTLKKVIDTHVHADHVTASGCLAKSTKADIIMGTQSRVPSSVNCVSNGDNISCGELRLTALHTPGHTDDSYCYVMQDRVFTGDTLLIRSTGRTDFQNGDECCAYESLFDILFSLPDETLVFPAHDYNGMTVSTIGEEKRYNQRCQVQSKAQYVKLMQELNLPKPRMIDLAVSQNQQLGVHYKKES